MVSRFRTAIALLALAAVGATACGTASAGLEPADPVLRTVNVTIHYSHFDPSTFSFPPGTTVRFVVRNTDPIDHEFIVGDAYVQQIHEDGTEPSHAPRPGEMSVPAGTTQTTTYTFSNTDGHLIFACHLPGHYAYGMRGLITIQG
jgi:uncharacterized cupredoxin-like copper-binding protein